ncbi:MAG TPA: glycosyltransferase family 87 protein [Acidimicrobiia bacterium]|jgi:hypothetical protein|nr:glycosyltransferase family 87 protein [Acidimicrobiia bacterium]
MQAGGQGTQTRRRAVVLTTVHLAIAVLVWRQITGAGSDYELTSGFGRYFAIATQHGTPYRDFGAEYPALAVGYFKVLAFGSFREFVRLALVCNFIAQAAILLMLFRGWGARAGWSYAALSAPLMPILYARFDLIGIALAVAGAYLVKRGHPTAGGITWVVAAFVKLWPAVMVPSLVVRRQTRALLTSIAVAVGGGLAWIAIGGLGAPRQVLTYRDARGWEFESIPGSLLRLATRHALRQESGAWRLGAPPAAIGALLGLATLAGVVGVWVYAARHGAVEGVAEVAAITIVLVGGTLLSPQFVGWLLPFVAIAAVAGATRIERGAGVVVALTFLAWSFFDVDHAGRMTTELATVARNVALVGLLVVAVQTLLRSTQAAAELAAA